MNLTNTRTFLELAQIAKQQGKLTPQVYRIYKYNAYLAHKRRMAADATAARWNTYENNYK